MLEKRNKPPLDRKYSPYCGGLNSLSKKSLTKIPYLGLDKRSQTPQNQKKRIWPGHIRNPSRWYLEYSLISVGQWISLLTCASIFEEYQRYTFATLPWLISHPRRPRPKIHARNVGRIFPITQNSISIDDWIVQFNGFVSFIDDYILKFFRASLSVCCSGTTIHENKNHTYDQAKSKNFLSTVSVQFNLVGILGICEHQLVAHYPFTSEFSIGYYWVHRKNVCLCLERTIFSRER